MGDYAPPSGYFRLNAFDPFIEVGKRAAVWAVNEDDALTRGSFRIAVRHYAFQLLMRDIWMISVLLSDRLNMQRRARWPVRPPRRLQRLERMHTKIHRNAFESLFSRAAPVHLERQLRLSPRCRSSVAPFAEFELASGPPVIRHD